MEKQFRGPVLLTEDVMNNGPCKWKHIELKKRGD